MIFSDFVDSFIPFRANLVPGRAVWTRLSALTLHFRYRILQFESAVKGPAPSQGSGYADSSHREDLAQQEMDQLGRREAPRSFSRRQLRFRRLRRYPLLQDYAEPS